MGKDFIHNLDQGTGPGIRLGLNSGVVLTSPPFNLACKAQQVLCEVAGYGGRIQTIVYELQGVPNALSSDVAVAY